MYKVQKFAPRFMHIKIKNNLNTNIHIQTKGSQSDLLSIDPLKFLVFDPDNYNEFILYNGFRQFCNIKNIESSTPWNWKYKIMQPYNMSIRTNNHIELDVHHNNNWYSECLPTNCTAIYECKNVVNSV